MARENKQYVSLCGGIQKSTSGMLMAYDELHHSVNACSDIIGILGKTLGYETFWDLGVGSSTHDVTRMQQLGAQYIALTSAGYLYKYDDPKVELATDVDPDTTLEVLIDHIFYLNQAGEIQSSDGLTETNKHLLNAPIDVEYIVSALGRLHAIKGNRVYSSSLQQSICASVGGEHSIGVSLINVDTNIYFQVGNHIDIYSDDTGSNLLVQNAEITGLTGNNQITLGSALQVTVPLGATIVYHDGWGLDTIMWATGEVNGEWYVVPGADGYPLGGINHYGSLLIIKSQSLWRDLGPGTELSKICDVGTTSPKTFRVSGSTGIFANTNGIYALQGNEVSKISKNVEKYIKASTLSPDKWCAGVDDSKYRLFIGHTDEEDVDNCELVIDMDSSKFDIRSGDEVTCYANFVVDGALGTYIGTTYGDIMKLNSGYKNLQSAIDFLVKTRWDNMGYPDFVKQWNRVTFFVVPGTIFDVFYSVDGKDEKYLGQVTKNPTSFDLTKIEKGVEIQFIFRESSKDVFPGIYGYEIYGDYDDMA